MRITKTSATTLLCLRPTGVAAGTSAAEPPTAEDRPALEVRGTDRGVGYDTRLSTDRRAAVTTLRAGRFLPTWDAQSVAVTDVSGVMVASLPLRHDIAGHRLDLMSAIDEGGRRLTLTPAGPAPAPARDISAQQRFLDVLQAHQPAVSQGAAIGAAIGFVLGFPAGLFMFDIFSVPIATVVGALVGAGVGLHNSGGQAAVDEARDALEDMVTGGGESPR
ncbi:hypothetical protein [Nocardia wallacei]|uniref:hypothetical protein n=1 Tax=Nocardia wallacei TaxID=480035 RepID=UPI00245443BC|nr:hypothetical protein [Nocardia wallacei]